MRPIRTRLAAALLFVAASSPAGADCTCRARGVVVTQGQTVCIPTPQGARLARCDKVSNVASWTFLDAPCPQAEREIGTELARSVVADSQPLAVLR